MLRPQFETVSLRYGCHEGEWRFPGDDRPVVIAGPNGSGKTTLLGGLVRTLFGFDRRRTQDAAEVDARQPWNKEGMRGRVVLKTNGDRFEIQRNFSTDRVRVYEPDEAVEHFVGDGNPGARNQEARHYRQILTDLMGLRDMDAYRHTLLIRQGELPATGLGDHLLRIAAGGHTRVEAARWQIAQTHRSITRRPIHAAAAAAINPREMEKLEEEIESVRDRLEAARAAGERRTPLTLDREQVSHRLEVLDSEIELLENALSALARTNATELNARHLRQEVERLEEAVETLRGALSELDDARSDQEEALAGGRYPDDFSERLARAELRWQDMADLQRPPAPWLGIAALAALAAAGALFVLEYPLEAAIAAGVGLLAGATWVTLWQWARRRLIAARDDIERLLEGVPAAESLAPRTGQRALARFRAQQAASTRLATARSDAAKAIRAARAALAEGESHARPRSARGRRGGAPTERLVARLEAAAEKARDRLAAGRVELDRIGDLSLALPDDVAPTEDAVSGALRERRAERARVQESLREVSQELLERGTASESVEALETLLSSLEPRLEALSRKAEVLEAAHALILDAYDEFRARDQDRLTAQVTTHVARLGGGRLEGVEAEDSLDEARVRTRGRLVPMASPPLSFGEFHALQLGVRLGAADFLAGIGIHPPLIIDEPFAHLDAERAATVWALLVEVARTRQVLVTTQDARLLDDLGVTPDIRLEP